MTYKCNFNKKCLITKLFVPSRIPKGDLALHDSMLNFFFFFFFFFFLTRKEIEFMHLAVDTYITKQISNSNAFNHYHRIKKTQPLTLTKVFNCIGSLHQYDVISGLCWRQTGTLTEFPRLASPPPPHPPVVVVPAPLSMLK